MAVSIGPAAGITDIERHRASRDEVAAAGGAIPAGQESRRVVRQAKKKRRCRWTPPQLSRPVVFV